MPKAVGEAQGKISGRIIIEQLIRNMELGQFEMGYSILMPCIFSLYLHPDDYARLTGVFDLIREDAKKALAGAIGGVERQAARDWARCAGPRIASRTRSRARIGPSNSFPIPKARCRWATWKFTPS